MQCVVEFLDRGVETTFDRPDGNVEHVGRLTVFESLEVNQQHDLADRLGQFADRLADRFVPLELLGPIARVVSVASSTSSKPEA